ncbi:hypothetical protein OZL92_07430 [Bacillus sonorensis]|uniref:Uncharacterized protein n=2 Tax=Bacillus sonorensis TaxID=119858 RepID=M5PD96_9BACI|nr:MULTISPECIES: hypothetical protein [Bacillus]TWK80811.1 hypothetical protein CHCC20335_0765 [Bacillus paralicheniformis]ASB86918.1 hypothetical protein S101395_00363 [Bacillus sonorensis]EME73592.1 hypothetical protein BSONL12_17779 [Bacillus sonorensis L12]MCF7616170.1 hypothetical protein [Bacillus sonorensis]MCY7857903.1 hypothetical protein [Bacillus sonorensis]
MNEKEPTQKPDAPHEEENFAKGCLFGILFSLPIWFIVYLLIKHFIIK